MKRIVIHVTLAVTMVLGIVGCTSDEEKMLKLVRADLVAEIPSLENYTPIESTIEVAKNDYIYDSVIMEKGIIMAVVKDAIDTLGRNGRMVCAAINLTDEVPRDNFMSLIEAIKEYRYLGSR